MTIEILLGRPRGEMQPNASKEVRELIKECEKRGCEIQHRKGGGHIAIKTPSGQTVFISSTPSDWRAIRKMKRDLKYAGVDLKDDQKRRKR